MNPSEGAVVARVLVVANKPCQPLRCRRVPARVKALMPMTRAETLNLCAPRGCRANDHGGIPGP
jgi:hypothetical protein